MARQKGKPTTGLEAKIEEKFLIGKRGMSFTVWKTHARSNLGEFYINVGGIHWRPYGKQNYKKISWNKLIKIFQNK